MRDHGRGQVDEPLCGPSTDTVTAGCKMFVASARTIVTHLRGGAGDALRQDGGTVQERDGRSWFRLPPNAADFSRQRL